MPARLFLPLALAAAATPAAAAAMDDALAQPALVPMNEIVVPIVDGARMQGRLRVKLVLRAADPAAAQRLRASMPALRETALAAVIEFARLRASPFVAVDAGRLCADVDGALRARDRDVRGTLLVEVSAVRA